MDEESDSKTVPIESEPKSSARQLLAAIEQSMLREPHDRVKCVHLFDNYFRCNWWAPPIEPNQNQSFDWGTSATHHVRKSRFLRVTTLDQKLTIEEVP